MKIKRLSAILVVLMFTGCQKDSTPVIPQPGDINSSEGSIVVSNQTFEELNGFANDYLTLNGLKSGTLGTCPSFAVTTNASFPKTITCDWGTGCKNDDGITRSGKITITLTGLMNTVNSIATFTFVDFMNDGNKITGVHRITYKGLNSGNNWPRYEVFTEAKIEFPDKKFINYRAEYTRLQSAGFDTPLILSDDVWRIEGVTSGTTREGKTWVANYPSALVKKYSCKWFSSGSVLITPEGEPSRTINFGDGTCDNDATLIIGDKTIGIKL